MPSHDIAERYRILTAHWPDFPPAEAEATCISRDVKFRHDVERLHQLGPRAVYEYLVEVGAARSIRTFLEDRITDFADLDPDALAVLAARDLPPVPLHEVRI